MAVAAGPSYTAIPERGFLELAGADARGFLQGLVSNDVTKLAPDHAVWTALLTPQGKYAFDFLVYQTPNGTILLDTEAARLDELERRLAMYRLRADVVLSRPPPELGVVAVFPGKPVQAPADEVVAELPAMIVSADPRTPLLGWRLVGRAPALEAGMAAAGWAAVPFATWDRARIAAAVPDGTRDLVVQKSILLESNFEELNGVAFDKGCFIGQELTARTKHRGLVRKRLVPVRIEGTPPEPGALIMAGEQEAGEMRSRADDLGLALLRLDRLGIEPLRAGEARLMPLLPPWLAKGG